MSKQFQEVESFNRDLLGVAKRSLGEQPVSEVMLSLKQLREEIDEFEQAFVEKDFIGQIDAMIDLQYFAFGVMYKMGLDGKTYEKIFTAVHEANMLKKAGINAKRGDHGAVDASKPKEWVDPAMKIAAILDDA